MTTCTNCGESAAETYCARCGEKQPGHHDLALGHFAHDVVHEFAHLDSKLFHTLRDLIVRPGFLTAEHFAGRKTRSIAPLRLFLTLFALQFLAFTFYKPAAIYSIATITKLDAGGMLARKIERKAQKHHISVEEYQDRVDERWHHNYSLLQLVNILSVALVLKIVYFRRYLVEHLVFAAHFLSFTYLLSLVLAFPVYLALGIHPGPLRTTISAINIIIGLVYLFLAQRFFYRESPAATTLKTLFVAAGRYAIGGVLLGGSLIVALMMID